MSASEYQPEYQYVIEVPATSANVGVGYDCLGFALDVRARFLVGKAQELVIDGCDERFCGSNNLVWASYCLACKRFGYEPAPFALYIDSPIPVSGGLGSSSTCVVAGIAAAQLLHDGTVSLDEILQLATQIEGHPDNVAPAILGGVVSAFVNEEEVVATRRDVSDKLRFVVIAPENEVRTEGAREIMPKQVPLDVVVWQLSRCLPTAAALVQGDVDLLAKACTDKLHEPYRKQLIPCYEACKEAAYSAGAATYYISGSGSAMLAVCDSEQTAANIYEAVHAIEPSAWLRVCQASGKGLSYSEAS